MTSERTADELNRFREKLLDITNKNPLVNFRKPRASTLQIIDELPDEVFSRLVSLGKRFRFAPKVEEPVGSAAEASAYSGTLLPPSLADPTTENASPELPDVPRDGVEIDARYTDDKLQTDRTEESLNAILKSMARRAQTAIEETGVNYLFLVLGLLSWKENVGGREHLAPLILIPVEIERYFDGRSSRYEYAIRWREEELQGNLCLAKRLERDFNVRFPLYEDDVTPEQYFEAVQREVCAARDWTVRREALLGFFSFQKLLMYLDLDPANWVKSGSLESSSVASQVIWGRDIEVCDGLYAEDYFVDADPTARELVVTLDADSSQHSALADIAAGKSLVIEGPPGTGKSQTIANAIAIAICEGKTVLFVAEKLAALKVVEHKLETLGLSNFCLELHSDAASPKYVFQSLRHRLDARYQHPRELESLKVELERQKQLLSDYLTASKRIVGPHKEPLYELAWRVIDERARGCMALRTATVNTDVTAQQFNDAAQRLEAFSETLLEMEQPTKSPWWGFWPHNLNPNDCSPIQLLLGEMQRVWHNAQRIAEHLECNFGRKTVEWVELMLTNQEAIDELENLAIQSDSLADAQNAALLLPPQARDIARKFANTIDEMRQLERQLDGRVLSSFDKAAGSADELMNLLVQHIVPRLPNAHWRTLRQLTPRISTLLTVLADVEQLTHEMQSQGLGQVRTLAEFERAEFLAKLVRHPIVVDRTDIPAPLFLRSAPRTIVSAQATAESLRAMKSKLESAFHLDAAPGREELLQLIKKIRVHGHSWLRVFRREFRDAKRKLAEFCMPAIGKHPRQWLEHLQLLCTWQSDYFAFCSNDEYIRTLGSAFRGLDTDWDECKTLCQWATTALNNGFDHPAACELLQRRNVTTLTPQRLQAAKSIVKSELNDQVVHLLGYDTSTPREQLQFRDVARRASTLHKILQQVEQSANVFTVSDDMAIADVVKICGLAKRAGQLLDALNDDSRWTCLGRWYSPTVRDSTPLVAAIDWVDRFVALQLPKQAQEIILETDPANSMGALHAAMQQLAAEYAAWQRYKASLNEFGDSSPDWLPWRVGGQRAADVGHLLDTLVQRIEALPSWSAFCRAKAQCDEIGLGDFTAAVLDGQVEITGAARCFRLTVLERIVESNIWGSRTLKAFSRKAIEKARNRFQDLDRELLKLNRSLIAHKASQRRAPAGVSQGRVSEFTEMGLIRREVQKQQKHCRIRDLLRRAGAAVQALKPCFMMSPLSVAQFLDPAGVEFDLVIMDEASQIKPEDALGTLLRAKQLVVVGDPKQLPPTTFFDSLDDGVQDDDATQFDNVESILEVAMKAFQPARRLKWHYRSKHESLIRFSNERFYDGDLVVFPSATGVAENLGIRYHHIDDGFFEGQCNVREAEVVARAIVEHAKRAPGESLGVGTFNAKQSGVILDLVQRFCERDPEAREAVDNLNSHSEKLFVKNLENLQGDERDVIFISYTYGPDRNSGRVFNRFGPVNGKTGWRRINVLVSRARRRLEVFSSLNPSDIIGGPDKSDGVNAFRDFLEFAQNGCLVDRGSFTGRDLQSPFEEAVARVIQKMGLEVVPQVGVAGYFIDLGVRRRGENDFLLGVECDGKTYHSAKSARDRDRLREEVIVSRGWRIHRIWSTDWYLNQRHEEQRLRQALESLAVAHS